MALRDFFLGQATAPARPGRVYRPTRARALIAAATPAKSIPEARQLFQPWQAEALAFYDKLGACHYPAQAHAAMVSRVRLFLGVRDRASGDVQEIDDSKGILSRFEDAGGGHSSLLSNYAILRFLCGDSYLLQTKDEDDPDGELFEVVSPLELRMKGTTPRDGYQRIRAPGLSPEELIEAPEEDLDVVDMDEARVWRLHRRHPAYSEWADSPVRAVLPLYRELELLHREAESQLRSRIARMGILFIDGRLTFDVAGSGEEEGEPAGTADEDPEHDELLEALIEAIVAAISDPDSPAAHSPVIARVEHNTGLKLADLIYHWKSDLETEIPSTERIEKVIGWIAQGIDLPPEILLGFQDSNHWSAWLVDEQSWEAHGEPVTMAFCQDITEAYVRPKAIAESLEKAENIVCWYDAAQVTTDPDRSKNARELYIDGELSGETYRAARGFGDEDEPDEKERARFLAIKLRDAALLAGREGEEPPETDETGPDIERSEPVEGEPEPESPPADLQGSGNGTLEEALRGAAEFALHRGRELAGSRLLGVLRHSPSCSCETCTANIVEGMAAIAKARIASHLGEETVLRLAESPELLVAGAGESLFEVAVRLGVDPERAAVLAEGVERYAADTLYEDDPPPVPLP